MTGDSGGIGVDVVVGKREGLVVIVYRWRSRRWDKGWIRRRLGMFLTLFPSQPPDHPQLHSLNPIQQSHLPTTLSPPLITPRSTKD